jgi:hypothetical protein
MSYTAEAFNNGMLTSSSGRISGLVGRRKTLERTSTKPNNAKALAPTRKSLLAEPFSHRTVLKSTLVGIFHPSSYKYLQAGKMSSFSALTTIRNRTPQTERSTISASLMNSVGVLRRLPTLTAFAHACHSEGSSAI